MTADHDILSRYKEGSLNAEQLNSNISAAWNELRNDPEAVATIEDRLGLDSEFFGLEQSPFHAQLEKSGLTGGEVAIFVAKGIASGVLAKLGAEGFEMLRRLWADYLKRKVNPPGSNNIGEHIDE